MKILGAEETSALLPYSALARQLKSVLADKREGRASAPARLHQSLAGGGVLLLMPAADEEITITKLVTVHAGNAYAGLPSVQAEVLVFDTRTGRRLLWLDGTVVTARRTAALSLLAAQTLAPNPAGSLLVVGAGAQARSHIEAMVEGLDIKKVYIASRRLAQSAQLAAYSRALGVEAEPVESPDAVLGEATLIVTATTSPSPVLGAGVRAYAFVVAVGSYQADRAELPPELVRNARLFVDTLEGAQTEAGDLIMAGVDWAEVVPLEDAVLLPRPTQGPVIFKSVGHALWDLAAARLAWGTLASADTSSQPAT